MAVRSVNRALRDRLLPNRLVVQSESRTTKGRPSPIYRLNPEAPSLDERAESFGVLDWQERTSERYERERGGYREVQRQREQAVREQHEAARKKAAEEWAIQRANGAFDPFEDPIETLDTPKIPDPFADYVPFDPYVSSSTAEEDQPRYWDLDELCPPTGMTDTGDPRDPFSSAFVPKR